MGWYNRNSAEPLTEGMKAAETTEHNTVNKKEFRVGWGKRRNYGKIKERNMELAEKSWLRSQNGSHVIC